MRGGYKEIVLCGLLFKECCEISYDVGFVDNLLRFSTIRRKDS